MLSSSYYCKEEEARRQVLFLPFFICKFGRGPTGQYVFKLYLLHTRSFVEDCTNGVSVVIKDRCY